MLWRNLWLVVVFLSLNLACFQAISSPIRIGPKVEAADTSGEEAAQLSARRLASECHSILDKLGQVAPHTTYKKNQAAPKKGLFAAAKEGVAKVLNQIPPLGGMGGKDPGNLFLFWNWKYAFQHRKDAPAGQRFLPGTMNSLEVPAADQPAQETPAAPEKPAITETKKQWQATYEPYAQEDSTDQSRAYGAFIASVYRTRAEAEPVMYYSPAQKGPEEVSKPIRALALKHGSIPRHLSDQIGEQSNQLRGQIENKMKEFQLRLEALGEDYLPEPQQIVVEVMRQVAAGSRMRSGPRHLLQPLVDFINSAQESFFRLRVATQKVDAAQAELLVLLMELNVADSINTQDVRIKELIDDLMVATHRATTRPLSDRSHQTLMWMAKRFSSQQRWRWVALAEHPFSYFTAFVPWWNREKGVEPAPDIGERLEAQIKRTRAAEAELSHMRVHYGNRYFAWLAITDFLGGTTQPDGNQNVELSSILMYVIDQGLDDYPSLRDFYLGVFTESKKNTFIHPTFQEEILFEGNPRDVYQKFGPQRGDPVLVQEMMDPHCLRVEHQRALLDSLTAAVARMESLQKSRDGKSRAEKKREQAETAAKAVVEGFKGSFLGLPENAVKQIWELFIFQGDPYKAATDKSKPAQPAVTAIVPHTLPVYLDVHLSKNHSLYEVPREYAYMQTGGRDLPFAILPEPPPASATEKESKKEPLPEPIPDPGSAYTYFTLILQTLGNQARDYYAIDRDLQIEAYRRPDHAPVTFEDRMDLEGMRNRVLVDLWQLSQALRESYIAEGKSEDEANLMAISVMCRGIEADPTLARLLVGKLIPQLNILGNELILRTLRTKFGSRYDITNSEIAALAVSPEENNRIMAQHTHAIWKVGISTAVIALVVAKGPDYAKPVASSIYHWALGDGDDEEKKKKEESDKKEKEEETEDKKAAAN